MLIALRMRLHGPIAYIQRNVMIMVAASSQLVFARLCRPTLALWGEREREFARIVFNNCQHEEDENVRTRVFENK